MEAINIQVIFAFAVGVMVIYLIYTFTVDKRNLEDNQQTINHHINSYNAILKLAKKVLQQIEKKHLAEERLYNRFEIEKETKALKELTEKVQSLTDRIDKLSIEEQRLTAVIHSKKTDIQSYDLRIKEKIGDIKEFEQSQLTTEEREEADKPKKKTAPKRPDFMK